MRSIAFLLAITRVALAAAFSPVSVETTSVRDCMVRLSGIHPVYLYPGDFITVQFNDDPSIRDLLAMRAAQRSRRLDLPQELARLIPYGASVSYPCGPNLATPLGLSCLPTGVAVRTQLTSTGTTFLGRGHQSVMRLERRDLELLVPDTQTIIGVSPENVDEVGLADLNGAANFDDDGIFSISTFRHHRVMLYSGQTHPDLKLRVGDYLEIGLDGEVNSATHYEEASDLATAASPLWDQQVLPMDTSLRPLRSRHRPVRVGFGKIIIYDQPFYAFSPEIVPKKLAEIRVVVTEAQ